MSHTYFVGCAPGEVAFLRGAFGEMLQASPRSRWGIQVDADFLSEQEAMDELVNEGRCDAYAISQAVSSYIERQRLPRLTNRAKAFLYDRLKAARDACIHWLVEHNELANTRPTVPPADAKRRVVRLVTEYWDDTGVYAWAREMFPYVVERPQEYYRERAEEEEARHYWRGSEDNDD